MRTIKTISIKKYAIMVIFLLTFFMGCSEDTIPHKPPGEGDGVVNGSAYATNYAYAWGLGSYSNSTAEDFVLELSNGSSTGIFYSNETTTIVSINILSLTSDKIAPGIYTFNGSDTHVEFTFEEAYAHINMTNQNGDLLDGDRFENAKGGTIKVSYPEGIFKIEYEIELANGISLSGIYTGKVGYFKI